MVNFSTISRFFPRNYLEELSNRSRISAELKHTLEILESRHGLFFDADERCRNREDLARKDAWERYLRSANKNGFFEDREILNRLRELEGDNFRSALAECIVCWFFDTRLRVPILPRPDGRKGKVLDMEIVLDTTSVGVEVKSPFRAIEQGAWVGNDADLIAKSLSSANKQFADDKPNIVALVPYLRMPLSQDRLSLIEALLGREVIKFDVDKSSGRTISEPKRGFVLDGKFTKQIKENSSPGYTRTSAMLVIEETRVYKTVSFFGKYFELSNRVSHNILILHNPYAKYSLSPDRFRRWPQLVRIDNHICWTDKQ